MDQLLRSVWRDEDGQDLIEYTLLIAFVVCITAGLMSFGGDSIRGIVKTTNAQLAEADRVAGS